MVGAVTVSTGADALFTATPVKSKVILPFRSALFAAVTRTRAKNVLLRHW
jgi:hypothetical protein